MSSIAERAGATAPAERGDRVELAIEGMTCASCAARIERRLNELAGVRASVSYASERAAVAFDPARVSVQDLLATVAAAGYHASLADEALGEGDPAAPYRLRLIIAAALSLPLAVLAWVAAARFSGWEWVSLGLTTPVVFYCGWPFHRAAAAGARH